MNRAFHVSCAALAAAVAGAAPAVQAQSVRADDRGGEEIVVTGTARDARLGDLAQPVTVLRGEALDRVRAATLGETLTSELGVSSSYFGGGASRPVIRGLAGARVRTLEDGIDALDVAATSDDHAVAIDPLVADQVEIFRGPTTLLYGSGAVGGVVNTVTSRIPEVAPGGLQGAFELRADSAADGRDAALRLDGGAATFAWHFDALRRDSGDYEAPGPGVVENSAVETGALAIGGSWIGENALFGLAVSRFETFYGIPGAHPHHGHHGEEDAEEGEDAHHDDADAPLARIDLRQTRVDLKARWRNLGRAFEQADLRIGLNAYEHAELEGATTGTRFTNDASEARLTLSHAPLGAWSGAVGVQVGNRDFAALGEEAFVPPVVTRSYGIFAVEERELERWRIALGARVEAQRHSPRGGASVSGDATSVSLAAVRRLAGGRSLAANVAVAERLPAAEELFALPDVPHLASRMFQSGDPGLREETARHVDLGIRRAGSSSWSVTGFLTRYDDFVFLADTGAVVDALPVFAFTQRDAELRGLEAELFTPIARVGGGEIDLRVFGDYVEGRLGGGERLPRIPPRRYGARLQYHDARFLAGLAATRYARQDDTAPYETPTAGYTTVDADLRFRIGRTRGVPLDLFVRAMNLRDAEARKHTSFVKDLAPLPGRNFALGVRASW